MGLPPQYRNPTRNAVLGQVLALVLLASGCDSCRSSSPPQLERHEALIGDAQIWVVDDGERVSGDLGASPLMQGDPDGVWQPGQPIRLFGLPGETLAFQVVVSGGDRALSGVRVEIPRLVGPGGDLAKKHVARSVVFDLPMTRRSGGKTPRESLGWEAAAMPPGPAPGGSLPDPLIPVELAPSWADYPLSVKPGRHRVVWVEIEVPSSWASGHHEGVVEVRAGSELTKSLPLELELGSGALPYAAVNTMLYFDPAEVRGRVGSQRAVEQALALFHRHHISTIYPVRTEKEARAYSRAFSGALFQEEQGYRGPGAGRPGGVVAIGAYGSLGEPTPARLREVGAILLVLEEAGFRDEPGRRDVFLYAVDEQCKNPVAAHWRKALKASPDPRLQGLRVAHTCSDPPADQAVDLVMMFSAAYSRGHTASGVTSKKHVWIYNGVLPMTGSYLTDAWPMSLRANPWIQHDSGIERWFYWEATFWNDDNRGGLGPYDPFSTAETFHNQHGDHCNGDGVLVYPGTQAQFPAHDLGFDGVVPSFRLAQWRRGIQDAGYLRLAHARAPKRTEAVLRRMVPKALDEVRGQKRPAWPTQGVEWLKARRELFQLLR